LTILLKNVTKTLSHADSSSISTYEIYDGGTSLPIRIDFSSAFPV